ncbi:hypothetical protein [Caballeronia cordobensis]|uniref:hypothetical protein n=1 Tax=Caballeronia cordobensis TaxID=1353886 RepID=UPI0006AD7044|nr:hypothetical protein [Caballeronia cordobensis]
MIELLVDGERQLIRDANKTLLFDILFKAVGLCLCLDLDDTLSAATRFDYTYEGAELHQPTALRINVRMALRR